MKQGRRLDGSRPVHQPGRALQKKLETDTPLTVTVVLDVGADLDLSGTCAAMTWADLEEACRPPDEHIRRVIDFASDHHLEVLDASAVRHDVVLAGCAADLGRAFGVDLELFAHEEGAYHSHPGEIHLPEDLADIVASVVGLSGAPVGRCFARPASAGAEAFTPGTLARAYRFPQDADGAGERIAILSFGGGYYEPDMDHYFRDVAGVEKPPRVRWFSVCGATNRPLPRDVMAPIATAWDDPANSMAALGSDFADFGRSIYTVETTQDVQIAGAIAPGAAIDVYFAPNDAHGWYHAMYAALGVSSRLAEGASGTEALPAAPPAAISVSFGNSENNWNDADWSSFQKALDKAAAMGVVVCCASGDRGSSNVPPGSTAGVATVTAPASSPTVLACGGTDVTISGGEIVDEVVWNHPDRGIEQASGGGVSGHWPRPWFQDGADVPAHGALNGPAWLNPRVPPGAEDGFQGRGVPDVAAYANPLVGYKIELAGVVTASGGTSASTPLWAALVALLSARVGRRIGPLTPLLYTPQCRAALRPITVGDNKIGGDDVASFAARPGWNPCCGLGSPDGEKLAECLQALFREAAEAGE